MEILIAIAGGVMVFFMIWKRKYRFAKKKLRRLTYRSGELAHLHNLNFSSQVLLHDMILGIDGQHRKLMLLKTSEGKTDCTLIDLDKLRTCSIHREYLTVESGEHEKKNQPYLRSIFLHLELLNGEILRLPFYEKGREHQQELKESDSRARDWESMLNKMLVKQKRA